MNKSIIIRRRIKFGIEWTSLHNLSNTSAKRFVWIIVSLC